MPTTGFRAFLAPRLTPLKEHLLARIAAEPLPPREMEWLFVQSLGMRHWLTLQIADRFGCAGSLHLPFPRDLMTNAARWVKERTDGSERFSREALLWRGLDTLVGAVIAIAVTLVIPVGARPEPVWHT